MRLRKDYKSHLDDVAKKTVWDRNPTRIYLDDAAIFFLGLDFKDILVVENQNRNTINMRLT